MGKIKAGMSKEAWEAKKAEAQQQKTNEEFQKRMNRPVSVGELLGHVQPTMMAVEKHEMAFAYLVEKGLEIRDGRVFLNIEELQQFADEKEKQRAAATATAEEAPAAEGTGQ